MVIGLFTLWIYPAYKVAKLQMEALPKAGLQEEDNTLIYIILCVFGLAIVVDILVQSSINKMVTGR
jgi:hypothetical protein